ncbi:DUF4296 domain-containing protein [Psychroserpens sp. NJDZ02]|uniref:DUF4296 domain-containing protein n=1 Tax=Psychroserpens sp. NJDZ02 TaxID=2570561 RepID=UPI0010A758FE|nr:DUF4296 domain-containing protein [Psychroserpens sp. NJDZ02]QCE41473.1 DUF4296 domain-containing protein [Psychroserpens sp. NJDZ02]
MKQNPLIYILLVLLFVSCYGVQKPDKPDDLLSEDKMVDVLVDLTIMSSAKGINKRELENRGIMPDSFIYNKHKIDSAQFVSSNDYYAYDIEKYNEMYVKVKTKLEDLRAFYKAEEEKSKEKQKKEKLKLSKNKLKGPIKK